MLSYEKAKQNSSRYIFDRHLYVGSIIKDLYNPKEYNNLCEIAAGNLELATNLSKTYKQIDAYELIYNRNENTVISNLNIYGAFTKFVNIEKYDLLLSVCPYYYGSYDYDYDIDPELETQELLFNIINMCLEKEKELFLVLANTYSVPEFLDIINKNEKYNKIFIDSIDLYYIKMGELKTSHNKVLMLKK